MSALVLFLTCLNLLHFTSSRFQHLVNPSCTAKDKICEFQFNIHHMETMTYYTFDKDMAVPVVYRNGSFYKRDAFSCDNLEELSKRELQEVATADGSTKMLYAINGQFPGPPIVVYEGQTVVINVKNRLLNEGLTIHWHGIVQKGTPWMDGASMLTQCPINTNEIFQYRFKADPSGTHWYHSHHGTQRTEGMAGPFIVLPKPENERNDIPEVDKDFMMMVQDWTRNKSAMEINQIQYWMMGLYSNDRNSSTCYHETQAADNTDIGNIPFHSALINGRGHFYPNNDGVPDIPELPLEIFQVKQDRYFRFRIINAAMLFPFRISLDQHTMEVVSTDGYDVEPHVTESVIVASGERIDVIVKADADIGNYWIRVETLATKDKYGKPRRPGQVLGILRYDGAKDEFPTSSRRRCTEESPCTAVNCPFSQYPREDNIRCIPLTDLKSTEALLKKYPVPEGQLFEDFLNFHFAGNENNRYTSAISARKFEPPSCPPQVTYVPTAQICFDDCNNYNCKDAWCKCTYTLQLRELNNSVQFVFVNNDDLPMGTSHPIHIHGHGIHIIKMGFAETDEQTASIIGDNPDITCSGKDCRNPRWTNEDWEGGNVPGANIKNPPIKDTVVVPRKGYVVVRFPTDNPGYWYMHCHVETHQLEGMTIILKEGLHRLMARPPPNFPLCGSFSWTEEKFQEYLSQINPAERVSSSTSSGKYKTTDNREDNTNQNTSSKVLSTYNDLDRIVTISLTRTVFVLVVLVFVFIILSLTGVILCLYKSRYATHERAILQSSQHLYYGSLTNTK